MTTTDTEYRHDGTSVLMSHGFVILPNGHDHVFYSSDTSSGSMLCGDWCRLPVSSKRAFDKQARELKKLVQKKQDQVDYGIPVTMKRVCHDDKKLIVVRVTKTQIIAACGTRFLRRGGRRVGYDGRLTDSSLALVTQLAAERQQVDFVEERKPPPTDQSGRLFEGDVRTKSDRR